MSDERDNAMEIARLQGDNQAIRAEMQAMESRIEASLGRMERKIAERDAEAAKRETRLLLAVAGLIAAGIAILSFMIRAGG